MIHISAIEPREVPFFWPRIDRWIRASQERGPSDMHPGMMRGLCMRDPAWRLLIFDNCIGAAVIRILDGNLHVVALGGRNLPPGWLPEFVDWLRSLAQFFGHPYVTMAGRKGWKRRLEPLGFRDIGSGWLALPVPAREREA